MLAVPVKFKHNDCNTRIYLTTDDAQSKWIESLHLTVENNGNSSHFSGALGTCQTLRGDVSAFVTNPVLETRTLRLGKDTQPPLPSQPASCTASTPSQALPACRLKALTIRTEFTDEIPTSRRVKPRPRRYRSLSPSGPEPAA